MSGEDKMDNTRDMKENDDIWLKQWKDILDDYEEEVPVNGWERLQADLQANEPLKEVAPKAKVIPFRQWKIVAAAAVVVLVAGAGIWFLVSEQMSQVSSVDAAIAQLSQTDVPDMTPLETIEGAKDEAEEDEISTLVSDELSPEDEEQAQPQKAPAVKQQQKTSAPAVTATPKTQTSSTIAQAKVSEVKTQETQREGTPIQVRNVSKNEAQRSATPVTVGSNSKATSEEVGVVNKRQVRVSTDERLQNVTHLRGQSNAITRSYIEVTDMDRVYNSFSAHYDELYNKSERLFNNGTGAYSTLDNALFLAGLVKKMQNQRSATDEQLFREIASRFVELQQPNGLWKDSLLDPSSHNVDADTESYICYALAWGLNNGLLSRKQYLDAVQHAWKSIGNCNSEPCLMAAEQVNKLQ
jgi:hypothetical protein